MDLQKIVEISSILVFFAGFYGLISTKNIIKSIASIGLMEIAVVMFLLSFVYFPGIKPPIGQDMHNFYVADPLPQALVITAIIIGIAVTAVNLTMLITLFRQHKTTDWDIIKKKNTE